MSWANGLQPWMRQQAEYLLSLFPLLRVTSTFRSVSEQRDLYNRWLYYRRKGYDDAWICREAHICTPAPPGKSLHNYGRAFDLNGSGADLQAAAVIWKRLGGRWFPADPIHFEA